MIYNFIYFFHRAHFATVVLCIITAINVTKPIQNRLHPISQASKKPNTIEIIDKISKTVTIDIYSNIL